MTPSIAEDLVAITKILDAHTEQEQAAAMAFLRANYPQGGLDTAEPAEAQERERAQGRERQERHRAKSRDVERDDREALQEALRNAVTSNGQGTPAPPPDVSSGSVSKPRPKTASKAKKALDEAGIEKARSLLDAGDFKFLVACPEPFRTHWLIDPDWWVSLRDGYRKINSQVEASKCMSYVQGKFTLAQIEHLNLRERLRKWFSTAERWREEGERRREQRR